MSDTPRIRRLVLSKFRHFDFCDLELTHPETGEVLPRFCLVGPNGIGKSTLLELLYDPFDPGRFQGTNLPASSTDALVLCEVSLGSKSVYRASNGAGAFLWFDGEMERSDAWESLGDGFPGFAEFVERFGRFRLGEDEIPALGQAPLVFFSPQAAWIDRRRAEGFEEFLASRHRSRQDQYQRFLEKKKNHKRTVAEVQRQFTEQFPDVLDSVRDLWTPVLDDIYLDFDPHRDTPIVSSRSLAEVPFSELSPGLRQYLLRIAHVHARYFDDDSGGLLFLDDAEAGLNPELARNQVRFFEAMLEGRGGQLVATTHSPRVAALFLPEQRIHLHYDEQGAVAVSRQDAVEQGDKEKNASRTFDSSHAQLAQLKRAIEEADDQDELADLIDEMIDLRKK